MSFTRVLPSITIYSAFKKSHTRCFKEIGLLHYRLTIFPFPLPESHLELCRLKINSGVPILRTLSHVDGFFLLRIETKDLLSFFF